MATEPTTRQQVERLVRANPQIRAAEIARALGLSRARVSKLLEEMGYELRWVWQRARGKRKPPAPKS